MEKRNKIILFYNINSLYNDALIREKQGLPNNFISNNCITTTKCNSCILYPAIQRKVKYGEFIIPKKNIYI